MPGGQAVRWLFPFLLSAAMGLGTLLGFALFTDAWSQGGAAGDAGGAAGALLLILSLVATFVSASLTSIAAGLAHRSPPTPLLVRLGVGVATGAVVGALAPNQSDTAVALMWVGLLGVPAILSWTWRRAV